MIKKEKFIILHILINLLIFYVPYSFATQTIDINRGHINPINIAINKFFIEDSALNSTVNDISKVISNDLKTSGLFKIVRESAFIDYQLGVDHKPSFIAWRQISSDLLLNAKVIKVQGNKIKISFVLWDTVLEKSIFVEQLLFSKDLWRRAAHKISDKIYERVTGDKGYFDTRIAYVSESGSYFNRVKRIAVMDYDGANHQYMTDGKRLVLTPRISPKLDKILYLLYPPNKKTPKVYMMNLISKKEVLVGKFSGMSFSPRFSSNGIKALISIAKDGSTHIYEIDFLTMRITQITRGYSINTSPSYSPDGKKIVFNSDRSGSRQLYLMDSNGLNIERISFNGDVYASPSWSPRGDYIAFTKLSKNYGFVIGVMKPLSKDNEERTITGGYLVESPCWAPNGRMIIFTKVDFPRNKKVPGRSKLYIIDLTGHNEREIITPKDASDPDWSQQPSPNFTD